MTIGRLSRFGQITISIAFVLSVALQGIQPGAAQDLGKVRIKHNAHTGKVSFIGTDPGKPVNIHAAQAPGMTANDRAMSLVRAYATEFGLREPARELKLIKAQKLKGRQVTKYQQVYQDIPVLAGELNVDATDQGGLISMNGEISPELSLNTRPAISAEQAKKTALESLAKWYQSSPSDFSVTQPSLWIYDSRLLEPDGAAPSLVWRMDVTSKDAAVPLRELVLVDAQRGNIALHFNQVESAWNSNEPPATSTASAEPTPIAPPSEITSTATPVPTETILVLTDTPEPSSGTTSAPQTAETQSPPQAVVRSNAESLTATSRYVASTGADEGPCTNITLPCQTINYAIGQASDGDTIKVAVGTYTAIDRFIVTILKPVNLSGGWNSTFVAQTGFSTIDGQDARRGIVVHAASAIDRFIVQHGFQTPEEWESNGGAGIRIEEGATIISNSTIRENRGSGRGSGIALIGGSLELLNSTISDNEADSIGGGIWVGFNYPVLTVQNSTITKNWAPYGGGILVEQQGSFTMRNSIVAGNFANAGPDCEASSPNVSYSIIGNSTYCGFISGPGNYLNTDPQITGPVGMGGYYTLVNSSPAIDAGSDCTATDERGMARPQGSGCDIGAYEYAIAGTAASFGVMAGSGQRAAPGASFAAPLEVYVLDNAGSAVPDVNVTYVAPSSGASAGLPDIGTNMVTVQTDSAGIARATSGANGILGDYAVNVTVTGLPGSVSFSLSNAAWYVASAGNDANSCSVPSSPCLTINAAIDKAFSGDSIFIGGGTYTRSGEDYAVVRIPKPVSLFGGWDASFTNQNSLTIVDGGGVATGIQVDAGSNTISTMAIDRVVLQHGYGYRGGGISVYGSPATFVISNSAIHDNYAFSAGGGLWHGTGSLVVLSNSTVGSNSAPSGGGIKKEYASGSLKILNSTVARNTASSGGGLQLAGGSVVVRNSIIANNTSSSLGPDCSGIVTTSDHNIIGTLSGCALTSSVSDKVNVDPEMGAALIGEDGYYPLSAASPAIDAAIGDVCPAKDQRGVTRPQGGGCDIGAYEYQTPGAPVAFRLSSGSGQHSLPDTVFPLPLVAYAIDSAGNAVPGVQVTFTAPASGPSLYFAGGGHSISVTTDSGGLATVHATANSELGSYTVSASASGLPDQVRFTLRNRNERVWYVTPSGDDMANSCDTPSEPCASITAAIDKAAAGDTVYVALGTYTGSGSSVVTISKSVTISGGWDVTFSSQADYSIVDGQNERRGILENAKDGNVTLSRLIVESGQVSGPGAGIYSTGSLILDQCIVRKNTSDVSQQAIVVPVGGGIAANQLTITRSSITDNVGVGHAGGTLTAGGGISAGSTTLADSYVANNQLIASDTAGSAAGGGIFTYDLVMNGSTVSDNSVSTGANGYPKGGGIYALGKPVTINNSTIANNSVAGGHDPVGGGIYLQSGAWSINNSTIVGNQADFDAGIYVDRSYYSTTHILQNSILADNADKAGDHRSQCPLAAQATLANNLVDDISECTTPWPATNLVADPRLLPSPFGMPPYYVPGPGSPAIDAGSSASCPATDQRGKVRPQGTSCDIGAIEYLANGITPALAIPYRGTAQYVWIEHAAHIDPAVLVVDAVGSPVVGVGVTFTAPVSGPTGTFPGSSRTTAAVTDTNGIAVSAHLTANKTEGPYTILALVDGLDEPVAFRFTNDVQEVQTYTMNGSDSLAALPGSLRCDLGQPKCTDGLDPDADLVEEFAYQAYQFYKENLHRNGLDDANLPIISTVHFATNYHDAFWDGSEMVFGDGFVPSLDTVAHEFTSGVTQYESNLFYYYQSGAISESLADVFGELIERSYNGPGDLWMIGASPFSGWHSMSNPLVESMTDSDYDQGSSDNGGVHVNSGVNTKAAYLMVMGGTLNNQTVAGIGAEKTLAIYYEAQTHLLTSGSDYADLYDVLYQACLNLVGGSAGVVASDCQSVRDATDAVAMNAQPSPGLSPDAPLCATGLSPATIFYDDFESGTNNWSFGVLKGTQRWRLGSPYGPFAHSGDGFLYSDDYPAVVTDVVARTTANVSLPANAYLHFAHSYDFEYDIEDQPYYFDGGVLEYSTDNGGTWHDAGAIMTDNGYGGKIYLGSANHPERSNPLRGRLAFVAASHGYISTRVSLSSLAGKTVKFRWRMGLDYGGFSWGWWLDDVRIYTCRLFGKLSPATGLAGQASSVMLSWLPVSGATSYEYCFDTTDDNSCSTWLPQGTSTSAVISSLSPGTTYYWQVRAITAGGMVESDAADWWSFTTHAAPEAFGKSGPADGAVNQALQPLLTWEPSTGATEGYEYCFDTVDNGACDGSWTTTSQTSAALDNLALSTTYYWQARAHNVLFAADADGGSWFSFTTTPSIRTITGSIVVGGAAVGFTGSTPDGPVNGQVTTNADGHYFIDVPLHWSGRVTPANPRYAFIPAFTPYSDLTEDVSGQDYVPRALQKAVYLSAATSDGWVLESGEGTNLGGTMDLRSGTIRVGDDALRRQYRSILSFNTSSLPDGAVVTGSTLRLAAHSITPMNSDPLGIFQGLEIDIRTGFFGSMAALQPMDFQATANYSGVGPFYPSPAGLIYSIELPGEVFPYINKYTGGNGLTQFRLQFAVDDNNDGIANFISFFSGNSSKWGYDPRMISRHSKIVYRPSLTIMYYMP